MEEILQMSALELSKQIRHGSVSVKEAVEACKKQIQKSESQVHAYVSMDEKILAHRIKEVEEGIKSGRYTGPLAGVPVAVKDNICTRGQKTTCSSKMLENFVPTYDAQAVKQLEDAGMVILGKSLESGACTGWIFRRFLRGCGSGRSGDGTRFRYRWFHPSAGSLLWCDRAETDLRKSIPLWTDRLCILSGSDRTDR